MQVCTPYKKWATATPRPRDTKRKINTQNRLWDDLCGGLHHFSASELLDTSLDHPPPRGIEMPGSQKPAMGRHTGCALKSTLSSPLALSRKYDYSRLTTGEKEILGFYWAKARGFK
ncbi:hypothetical protein NDU88_000426 [Pleurodeles waltl]|uniref:Uncharacterized protein n=1 Tax=Pleurodeles waltl TaxID=8319 RepID=A0AAV7U695_PLEWA|nr:hypothetical protein NDU88_000426 [Pleurodeles waltl]